MLGILGGMGPASTEMLYKKIIDHTEASCDQEHLDLVILNHATVPDRTVSILEGKTDEILKILISDGKKLKTIGATFLAMPCNTAHTFIAELEEGVGLPFLNMVEETVLAVAEQGMKNIAVLATEGTVQAGLYHKSFEKQGISCLELSSEIQDLVTSLIYDQVKKGQPGKGEDIQKIDLFLKDHGVDCAILACTELSVLKETHQLPPFYVDAMDILWKQCILRGGGQIREEHHGT